MTSHWLLTAPAAAFPPADLPAETDLAILGGGIMGCALAYWLARHGRRPLLLERNAQPAGGATGRNGGLVVAGPPQAYAATVRAIGREPTRQIMDATLLNRRLLKEVLQREAIDAGYAHTGFLALGSHPEEIAILQESARAMQADGYAAEWLDRPAAEARLGTALGPAYVAALYKPDDAVIHSARYTLGVAQAAARLGARLAFGTPVNAVAPGPGGRGWRLSSPRGAVLAEQVVVTLNAWAGDLFPELSDFIVPTRGHIVLTAPVPFRVSPWIANWEYEYGRQLENGQLLVGGKRESRPDYDKGHPPPPGENVPPVLPAVVQALTDFIPTLFPAAAGVPVVHHWTGTMGYSPDDHPLAGHWPGRPGLWLLAGFTGHGMPYSQVLPYTLAARLAGRPGPAIPAAFDPARFLSASA